MGMGSGQTKALRNIINNLHLTAIMCGTLVNLTEINRIIIQILYTLQFKFSNHQNDY